MRSLGPRAFQLVRTIRVTSWPCGFAVLCVASVLDIHAADVVARDRPLAAVRRISTLDEPVGDDQTSYVDPEFLPERRLVAWQDYETSEVWICRLDLDTGDLIPPDGRETLVGVAARIVGDPFRRLLTGRGRIGSFNGPEWGNSREGLGLYFTVVDDQERFQVARYLLRRRRIELLTTDTDGNRIGCLPSSDVRDDQVRIGFLVSSEEVTLPLPTPKAFFQFAGDNATRGTIPLDVLSYSGPRWIPGQQAGVTTLFDANGTAQVARFDVATGQTTLLTTGPESHEEPLIVVDPVTSSPLYLTCAEDRRGIAIYRPTEAGWVKERVLFPQIQTLGSQFRSAVLTSIRPFLVGDRLMITASVAESDGVFSPTRICLLSADGTINLRISQTETNYNRDPEPVVGNDSVFVYYYASLPIPIKPLQTEFRRCRINLADLN